MQRGQAALEYVAVLAVVAVLFGLAGSVAAAPAIVNGVGRAFQRALCGLAHSGCATVDRRPCTVRTSTAGGAVTAKLAFVRIGAQAGLLRAERSDGSVSLTLLEHLDGGLTAGVGAGGRLRLGGVEVGEGATAELAAVARLGGGRTWALPDARSAHALQRHLVEALAGGAASHVPVVGAALGFAQKVIGVGSGRHLPRPSARVLDARAGIEAAADLPGGHGISAALALGGGLTIDAVTGARSVLVRVESDAGAKLAAGLVGLAGGGSASLALTYDRRGRPVELAASAGGHGAGSIAVRGIGAPALNGAAADGSSFTTSAVLDLRDAPARAAVSRLLRALRPDRAGDLSSAAGALAALLHSSGRVDVQRYGTREAGLGAAAQAGLGAEVGVDAQITRASTRLLDAWTRPAGGVWERRIDCLAR